MDQRALNIISKIKSGDKKVFEKIYATFFSELSYFSNQYLMDVDLADNIAQDVFVELWENRTRLDDQTNIRAWLFTVTKNKSLKVIRKEKTRQKFFDYQRYRQLEADYKALNSFETESFDFDELQEKIQESLMQLSPSVRSVFMKSRFEDKKNREISEELGISIKTVEAHISKALKILRIALKDYLYLIYLVFFLK